MPHQHQRLRIIIYSIIAQYNASHHQCQEGVPPIPGGWCGEPATRHGAVRASCAMRPHTTQGHRRTADAATIGTARALLLLAGAAPAEACHAARARAQRCRALGVELRGVICRGRSRTTCSCSPRRRSSISPRPICRRARRRGTRVAGRHTGASDRGTRGTQRWHRGGGTPVARPTQRSGSGGSRPSGTSGNRAARTAGTVGTLRKWSGAGRAARPSTAVRCIAAGTCPR